jgi:hypothetical protein
MITIIEAIKSFEITTTKDVWTDLSPEQREQIEIKILEDKSRRSIDL